MEFDKDLIFVPKIGKCIFNNPEFLTELNFTEQGRKTGNKLINKKENIAVEDSINQYPYSRNGDKESFLIASRKILNSKFTI